MDVSGIVVLVLLATVALRVGLVLAVVWLLIPQRTRCPQCGEPPLPLVTARPLAALRLERRWCYACGWEGVGKRTRHRGLAPSARHAAPGNPGEEGRWKARWDDDDQWSPVRDDEWRK
jgi:hypothetical protein